MVIKIVDFANAVIPLPESQTYQKQQCPPAHPDLPNKGYIKGIKSLRACFRKIWTDNKNTRDAELMGNLTLEQRLLLAEDESMNNDSDISV